MVKLSWDLRQWGFYVFNREFVCVRANVKRFPVTPFIVAGEASVTLHVMQCSPYESFFERCCRLSPVIYEAREGNGTLDFP